jgi:hypothetical protein
MEAEASEDDTFMGKGVCMWVGEGSEEGGLGLERDCVR